MGTIVIPSPPRAGFATLYIVILVSLVFGPYAHLFSPVAATA